jgi:hypothetical protein
VWIRNRKKERVENIKEQKPERKERGEGNKCHKSRIVKLGHLL